MTRVRIYKTWMVLREPQRFGRRERIEWYGWEYKYSKAKGSYSTISVGGSSLSLSLSHPQCTTHKGKEEVEFSLLPSHTLTPSPSFRFQSPLTLLKIPIILPSSALILLVIVWIFSVLRRAEEGFFNLFLFFV